MIRTIIIDDEANNIEDLRSMLGKSCHDVDIIATATHPEQGLKAIEQLRPDLLLLDIQMPGKSGFEVLKSLPSIPFEIIFVTAYDQYGLQAIKFSALDYLLKPVNPEELKTAVGKARERIVAKHRNLNIENLLSYIKANQDQVPKIALPTFEETLFIRVDHILRCQASSNYTEFYFQDGTKVLVSRTLKEMTELLKGYHFARTHQSHLVNLAFVKSLLKEDGGTLLLTDGTKIPISRQLRESVKEQIGSYVKIR
jgi:two-component system LytT family response regulator